MKKIIYLFIPFLFACNGMEDDCDNLAIDVDTAEYIYKLEPNIRVRFFATSYSHSHAHFKCAAWWDGPPLSYYAPTDLATELCIKGKCEKVPGGVAEFKVWAQDWNDLKNYEAAYCIVYMPEWQIMELQSSGDITVVETIEEHVIARVRYPITMTCQADDEPDSYCHDGYYSADGWVCTQWD